MTTTSPLLSPQVLGLAENAHRAILNCILAGTGITYQRWVVFSVTAVPDQIVDRDQVVGRAASALKAEADKVLQAIDWLAALGLVETVPGEVLRLRVTESGRIRHREIRGKIDEIVGRIYADIPAEDLTAAGRVLTLVTQRANAELALLSKGSM